MNQITYSWSADVERLHRLLGALSFTGPEGEALPADEAFARWQEWTTSLRDRKHTIFLVGNGASASMASHYAADLAKNGHLHTQVFSDLSLITAISNDISYEEVFAVPLRRSARPRDMLIAISSSGRSPNILRAVKVALEMGLDVVTLSAMDEDNPLRTQGVLNAYLPAQDYGHAETGHAAILHHWMDMVEVNE